MHEERQLAPAKQHGRAEPAGPSPALAGDALLDDAAAEVDETYMGGKRKNMPLSKRRELSGRGPVGKTAVVGAKDRETGKVTARSVQSTDGPTLQGFIEDHAAPGAIIYTDDARAYKGMPFDHEAVNIATHENCSFSWVVGLRRWRLARPLLF